MKYKGFTISALNDNSDDRKRYFCKVYAGPGYKGTLDFFCIHPHELDGCGNPKLIARRVRKLIRVYIRNNFDDLMELKVKVEARIAAESAEVAPQNK